MDNYQKDAFLAGMISGCFQTIVGHPLDTLKVYKQINTNKIINKNMLFHGLSFPLITNSFITGLQFYFFENHPLYMGLASALVITPVEYYKTHKQVFNKYELKIPRGFPITFLRENIALNIYFNSYNYFEPSYGTFLSGGLAGSFSWLFSYPFDTIKTRVQSNMTYLEAINHGKLFNGLSLALGRGFVVNACGFYSISILNKYILNNFI